MNIEEVERCTIFLTIVGSRAYGTHNPDSDTDIRGVCIPMDLSYYFGIGINKFEQQDGGWSDDRVIYDLRKAMNLMADGNPNMLDLLFVDERLWLGSSKLWERICIHKDKFLSKRIRYSYGGYAFAQLKRIKSHRGYLLNPPTEKPERAKFGLPAEKLLKADDIGAFQWLLSSFLKKSIWDMNLSDGTKNELDQYVNYIGLVQSNMANDLTTSQWDAIQKITGVSDEFMATMMKEKAYANALNNWNSYQEWKSARNQKRRELEAKYGYDTKHAMHLVRLLRMGIEALDSKQIIVCRPDAEELKAIRNGAWPYEKLEEYAEQCDIKLNELYKTTTLPNTPDRVFINQLCQKTIEKYIL